MFFKMFFVLIFSRLVSIRIFSFLRLQKLNGLDDPLFIYIFPDIITRKTTAFSRVPIIDIVWFNMWEDIFELGSCKIWLSVIQNCFSDDMFGESFRDNITVDKYQWRTKRLFTLVWFFIFYLLCNMAEVLL